jgi:hypothetical protein
MNQDPGNFETAVFDCFAAVVTHPLLFPYFSTQTVYRIFRAVAHSIFGTEDIILKAVQICVALRNSNPGFVYCHGEAAEMFYRTMFRCYKSTTSRQTTTTIRTILTTVTESLFDDFTKPLPLADTEDASELSFQVAQSLYDNTLVIQEQLSPVLCEGDFTPTTRHLDLFSFF